MRHRRCTPLARCSLTWPQVRFVPAARPNETTSLPRHTRHNTDGETDYLVAREVLLSKLALCEPRKLDASPPLCFLSPFVKPTIVECAPHRMSTHVLTHARSDTPSRRLDPHSFPPCFAQRPAT